MKSTEDLVGGIYDTALDRRPWRDVLEYLATRLEASSAVIYRPSKGLTSSDSHGVSPETLTAYNRHIQDDLWVNEKYRRADFGRVDLGEALVPADVMERSVLYNEVNRPFGGPFWIVSTTLRLTGGDLSLALHRQRHAEAFTQDAVHLLERILPALSGAMDLRQRLGNAALVQAGSHDFLNQVSRGIIHIGPLGNVLFANAAAEQILTRGDGLVARKTFLQATLPRDDARLQKGIADVVRTTSGQGVSGPAYLRIARQGSETFYAVTIMPLGRDRIALTSQTPAALVAIADPQMRPTVPTELLRAMLGLTPAEARLTGLLTTGITLIEAARLLGVSYNTVRSNLARVLAKTHTRTMAEVVSLALSCSPFG